MLICFEFGADVAEVIGTEQVVNCGGGCNVDSQVT